jgi:hypothetical protein
VILQAVYNVEGIQCSPRRHALVAFVPLRPVCFYDPRYLFPREPVPAV